MTETEQTPLSISSSGPDSAIKKKEEYKVLSQVADEMNFSLDDLVSMYMAESGGTFDAVNKKTGAKGGFQFLTKTGENYGLIDDSGDFRTDLKKSAVAAIELARHNTQDEILLPDGTDAKGHPKFKKSKNTFSSLLEKHDIPKDLGMYIAHQQGRGGFIDLLTGADSGRISDSTMVNMSENMGFNEEEIAQFKGNKNRGDSAKIFIEEWKTRWKTKEKDADNWLSVAAPQQDKIINSMKKEEDFNIMDESNAVQPDKTQ